MFVTKRDGTQEKYDVEKIRRAVLMAFNAVQPGNVPDVQSIVDDVHCLCVHKLDKGTLNIEEIQDAVERMLMVCYKDVAKAYILYRARRAELRAVHPDPSAVADYIHAAKYARGGETFEQTVIRVAAMHVAKFPQHVEEITQAFEHVHAKRVLPSMRSMQFAGEPIRRHAARMYNCSFTHVDRPEVFAEIFYLLLCGCGVGYSVQFQHVAKLPEVGRLHGSVLHHHVHDDIEGWAEAIKALCASYFHGAGFYVEFNYSNIRPEGSPLKTSGGVAPGHRPLKNVIDKLRVMFDRAVGRNLRPIECHDMICTIASAVLAGGIRRSSLISLFSIDDGEMLLCKSPDNFKHGDIRANANNSVVLHRKDCTQEQFLRAMEHNKRGYGEPGFLFVDDYDHGTNPCGEIGLDPVFEGSTGFAFCNLTEVNGAACHDVGTFYDAVEAATIIGTLQATYTSFHYLGQASQLIAERDALLGVSITGMYDNPGICFNSANLKAAAEVALRTNKDWSQMLGINPARCVTCIKPSGTASLELGCVASGIHPHHAKRYLRRIIANPLEPVAQEFKRVNPHMVTVMPNGDRSLTFPVEGSGPTVKDVSAEQLLKNVIMVNEAWVRTGQMGPPAHNVSATITFDEGEWNNLLLKVWANREALAALSFLPRSDDNYPFMPRQECTDERLWHSLIDGYRPVKYQASNETFDTTCEGDRCDAVR